MFFISSRQAEQIRSLITLEEDPKIRLLNTRVASANQLARRVAYELDAYFIPAEDLQSIEVYDEDGEIRTYYIEMIDTQHLGVVAYILKPISVDNHRLHLVFRGTKDRPAWCRNTETPAPGYASFYAERNTILSSLCLTIEGSNAIQKVHLIISGHSLGGSDAQHCAAEVMEALAEGHKSNPCFAEFSSLAQINKISINHANSAGISHSISSKGSDYAAYITKNLSVKINLMCVITAGDGVQQSGQSHILSDIDNTIAKVELVKLSSEYEGIISKKLIAASIVSLPFTYVFAACYATAAAYGAYKAHKMRFFDHAQFKSQNYIMYDNTTEEGRAIIQKKLAWHPLDNLFAIQSLRVVNFVQYCLTTTKRDRKKDTKSYVLINASDYLDMPEPALNESAVPVLKRRRCIIS